LRLSLGVLNELFFKPGDDRETDLDTELDKRTEENELWCWESMLVYHLKLDIETIQSWDDDKFFDMVARVRWVINEEQKNWKNKVGT